MCFGQGQGVIVDGEMPVTLLLMMIMLTGGNHASQASASPFGHQAAGLFISSCDDYKE